MTIKVVKPCVGGDGADPASLYTEAIIARLGALQKRSQQLLDAMMELEEGFRRHSERNGETPRGKQPK